MSMVETTPASDLRAGVVANRIIRATDVLEGAETLADAALQLNLLASWMRHLAAQGWTLESPIVGDAGVLVPPAQGVWDGLIGVVE